MGHVLKGRTSVATGSLVKDIQVDVNGVVQTSASGGGGTADSTAALQTAGNVLTGAVNETAPATDTASSGINGRAQRIAQNVTANGVLIGAVAETAAASNSASSGLNGLIRRLLGFFKLEDDAHASGDPGLMILGVRRDTASTLVGADGDYAPFQCDSAGSMRVAMTSGSVGSLTPGTGSAAMGKARDAVAGGTDTGLAIWAVRNDSDASTVSANLDYSPIAVDIASRVKIAPGSSLGTEYETVAASATDQVLGATGAAGDILSLLTIVPATTSPGAVTIKDVGGSAITIFTGGATSVADLKPFEVPGLGKSTGSGWSVTTGTNVSVIARGDFT